MLGAGMGASAAIVAYQTGDQNTVLAGHSAEIAPTFDGYATVQLGVLPDLRYPVDMPFDQGIRVTLGNSTIPTEATNSKQALERLTSIYGAVAARPDAELDVIEAALQRQAITSGAIGLGVGMTPLLASGLIGSRRRQELGEKLKADDAYRVLMVGGVAVSIVAGVGIANTERETDTQVNAQVPFVQLVQKIPSAGTVPELSKVEIRDTDFTTFGADLVKGGIDSFSQSKEFYNRVNEALDLAKDDIRLAEDGEELTLIYSDRHSNIGADSVIRNLVERSGATRAIGVGDETSTGAQWEEFSTRSIGQALENVDKAAILGNHDITPEGFVKKALADSGYMLANGEVQQFGDSSILLVDDNRSSGLTAERVSDLTDEEVAENVADIACEYGRVNMLITAKDDMAKKALEEGCVDIAISADTHIQTEPLAITGDNGSLGYTITNGTSGGAAYALALGKFRREASYTLLTTRNGVPVGVQTIRVGTDAVPNIGEYTGLLPSSLDQLIAEAEEDNEVAGQAVVDPR